MRRLWLLILLLTACDLQPAKKQKEQPAASPVVATPDAAVAPVDAPLKPIKANEECIAVGTHLAKLVYEAMIDDEAKAKQKESEANTIKSAAETCAKDKWTLEGRTCLLASKTLQDTNACNVKPPTE